MITGDKYGEVTSARRRLIRGTFAAPVVMALHSGSALAGLSNMSCLRSGMTVQPTAVWGSLDTYVRVPLYAQGNKWYLSGADVHRLASMGTARVSTAFLGSSTAWREVMTGANGTAALGGSPSSSMNGATAGQKYVALRFAPGGTDSNSIEIVGVVDGTGLGSALSNNCWYSAAGMAP